MKEKRTVYLVENTHDYTFKVFDTIAEAKTHILHEYLEWLDVTGFDPVTDVSGQIIKDLTSIDKYAYVDDVYYTHEAEYCGE